MEYGIFYRKKKKRKKKNHEDSNEVLNIFLLNFFFSLFKKNMISYSL